MDKKEVLIAFIGEEITNTKFWSEYVSAYVDYRIRFRKYITIGLSVISVIVAIIQSFAISSETQTKYKIIPIIVFAIIAFYQILSSVKVDIVISDSKLEQLHDFRRSLLKYMIDLEVLFCDLLDNKYELQYCLTNYKKLKNDNSIDIEEVKDRLNIKIHQSLYDHAMIDTQFYMKNKFNLDFKEAENIIDQRTSPG